MSRAHAATSVRPAPLEAGFTMIIAIGVMFVTSLLLVAAFTAANGDIHHLHTDVDAEAGVLRGARRRAGIRVQARGQPELLADLRTAPTSDRAGRKQPRATKSRRLPPAPTPKRRQRLQLAPTRSRRSSSRKGTLANTFRIKSVGLRRQKQARDRRQLPGGGLPQLHLLHAVRGAGPRRPQRHAPKNAEEAQLPRMERKNGRQMRRTSCSTTEDTVNGPMHTNDTRIRLHGQPNSAAEGHEPPDARRNQRRQSYAGCGGAAGSAKYYTANGADTKAPTWWRPESDTSLALRRTRTAGTTNSRAHRTRARRRDQQDQGDGVRLRQRRRTKRKKSAWPKNGLIYVQSNTEAGGCGYNRIRTRPKPTPRPPTKKKKTAAASTSTARTANR